MTSGFRPRTGALLLVPALLLTSCVRTASAEAEPTVPDPPSSLVEANSPVGPDLGSDTEDNDAALALVPSLLDPDIAGLHAVVNWIYSDEGTPFGFTTQALARLRFTELDPVQDDGQGAAIDVSTAYRVDGVFEHVATATACNSPKGSCRVVGLQDAELEGIAVRRQNVVTIDLRWRTFGPEDEPSRPGARIAIGLDEFGYLGVAEALEASRFVNSTIVVSLSSQNARSFRYTRGSIDASGSLTIGVG